MILTVIFAGKYTIMIAVVEVSMYPLTENYIPIIDKFLTDIRSFDDLHISTNPSSTRIQGEYDLVMKAMTECMKNIYAGDDKVTFVMKVLNTDITETKWDDC